jgi:hypothetical protein
VDNQDLSFGRRLLLGKAACAHDRFQAWPIGCLYATIVDHRALKRTQLCTRALFFSIFVTALLCVSGLGGFAENQY